MQAQDIIYDDFLFMFHNVQCGAVKNKVKITKRMYAELLANKNAHIAAMNEDRAKWSGGGYQEPLVEVYETLMGLKVEAQ